MKIVYSPKGKLSKYFFHKVYEEIEISVQQEQIFFSAPINISQSTVQLQGHGTFFYSKYATDPPAEFLETSILKGPLTKKVKISKLVDQDIPVDTPVKFLGSSIPLKVVEQKIEREYMTDYIKSIGIDNYAVEDIPFELMDRDVTPPPVIKQGCNYLTTEDESTYSGSSLLVDVPRPEVKVQIFRNDDTSETSGYGDLIYESVSYSFEEPTFWEGSINFLVLDNPPEKNRDYKYTVMAKCNNANTDAPIKIKYAAVTISQIM